MSFLPIAIIGIGCRFAGVRDARSFWRLSVGGIDATTEIPAERFLVAAYCELREAFRNFRTDRMKHLEVTADRFELASPCTLADYVAAMTAED